MLREDVGLPPVPATLALTEVGKKAGRARSAPKGRGQRGAQPAKGLPKKGRRAPAQAAPGDSDKNPWPDKRDKKAGKQKVRRTAPRPSGKR